MATRDFGVAVRQYSLDYEFMKEYKSLLEAAVARTVPIGKMRKVVNGRIEEFKDSYWRWADRDDIAIGTVLRFDRKGNLICRYDMAVDIAQGSTDMDNFLKAVNTGTMYHGFYWRKGSDVGDVTHIDVPDSSGFPVWKTDNILVFKDGKLLSYHYCMKDARDMYGFTEPSVALYRSTAGFTTRKGYHLVIANHLDEHLNVMALDLRREFEKKWDRLFSESCEAAMENPSMKDSIHNKYWQDYELAFKELIKDIKKLREFDNVCD